MTGPTIRPHFESQQAHMSGLLLSASNCSCMLGIDVDYVHNARIEQGCARNDLSITGMVVWDRKNTIIIKITRRLLSTFTSYHHRYSQVAKFCHLATAPDFSRKAMSLCEGLNRKRSLDPLTIPRLEQSTLVEPVRALVLKSVTVTRYR